MLGGQREVTTLLSLVQARTHCLIVLVRLVRLTRAHSAKQVKLIYARLPGLGAARQNGLCVGRLGSFWFEICEKFNLSVHPFHL